MDIKNSFISFLLWELKVQNQVNNIIRHLVIFILFVVLSMALVYSQSDINQLGTISLIIYLPLSIISLSGAILKNDLEDGTLEALMVPLSTGVIIMGKYLALVINSFISICFSMPIIIILFDISTTNLNGLVTVLLLIAMITGALVVLIATVQAYFRSNTNFLSLIILPIIMPNLVLASIFFQEFTNQYLINMIIGINCIVIPVSLWLSQYLLKNIYNISD